MIKLYIFIIITSFKKKKPPFLFSKSFDYCLVININYLLEALSYLCWSKYLKYDFTSFEQKANKPSKLFIVSLVLIFIKVKIVFFMNFCTLMQILILQ